MRPNPKKSWLVHVDAGGRVVLPAELRRDLGWQSGSILNLRRGARGSLLLTERILEEPGHARQ